MDTNQGKYKAELKRDLTKMEIQLLKTLANECCSFKELANIHGVSRLTVAVHMTHIYMKLGIHSSLLAVKWAVENGLVRWNIKS